jgi:acetyl esterase/lipase
MLDTRIALMLWVARRTGRTFRPDISVGALRATYAQTNRSFGLPNEGGVTTQDVRIPAGDGEIGARLYRPDGVAAPLPLLVFFHGGGFCIGDVASYDHLTRFFAREGRIAVLSVDYRLAPEHRFPRAHEDGFAALHWAQERAAELGVDAARIAVGGDSAGGSIAASLSAHADARGIARPAFQFLIYPSLDRHHDFPSARRYTKNLPLTRAEMDWFTERFLNGASDSEDPLLALLQTPNPERLPPTYLLAAQYDPLLDEGLVYAERLRAAGVPVVYDLQPTLPHAFVNLAGAVPAARRALHAGITATSEALRALRSGLGSGVERAFDP